MRASSYPLVDAAEASATVLEHTPVPGVGRVGIVACSGRVLAADLMAPFAMPTDPVSAVDGYAVRASDAGRTIRIIGESAAGKLFDGSVDTGVAVRILTGGVVPDGADCVAMLEEVALDGELVTMPPTLRAGSNVHRPGDDLRAGDLLVVKGTRLGPAELGLAAAVGCAELDVHKRPRVALMSTGNELIEVGGILERGKIFDSNRWALLAALNEAGADVTLLANAPDEAGLLRGLV